MWRRSHTWNSGQVFCPHAHVNSLANKRSTVTLSCLLLILTFVCKLQTVCGRNDYFSLVWCLASLITARTTLPGPNGISTTLQTTRFQALFSGWWGSLSLAGSPSAAGRAEPRASQAGQARQPRLRQGRPGRGSAGLWPQAPGPGHLVLCSSPKSCWL